MPYIIATLAGVFIILTRIINSSLSNRVGSLQGTIINYLTGLITSAILFIALFNPTFSTHTLTPLHILAYFGGVVGVGVVLVSNAITHKIDAFLMTVLAFLGQIVAGILLDVLVLKLPTWPEIFGVFCIFVGLIYHNYITAKQART